MFYDYILSERATKKFILPICSPPEVIPAKSPILNGFFCCNSLDSSAVRIRDPNLKQFEDGLDTKFDEMSRSASLTLDLAHEVATDFVAKMAITSLVAGLIFGKKYLRLGSKLMLYHCYIMQRARSEYFKGVIPYSCSLYHHLGRKTPSLSLFAWK